MSRSKFTITVREKWGMDFNKIHMFLLRNNVKIEDFIKNYLVFFVELDKNNRNELNVVFSLKNVADIDENIGN